GRPLPVPALGHRGLGPAGGALRRPRGDLHGRRRLRHGARSPAPPVRRDRGGGAQPHRGAAGDDGRGGREPGRPGGGAGDVMTTTATTTGTVRWLADAFVTFLETGE